MAPSTARTASAVVCSAARHVVDEQGRPRPEAGVEPRGLGVSASCAKRGRRVSTISVLGRADPGRCARRRPDRAPAPRHHRLDDRARLRGRVAGAHHPVEPVQHDPGERVHHRGEGGDRDHVARGLDRLLLGFSLHFLPPLLGGVRRQVAQLAQDARGCRPSGARSAAGSRPTPPRSRPRRRSRASPPGSRGRGAHLVEPHEALARTAPSCRRGASAGTTTRTGGSRSRARTRSARAARRCGARPRTSAGRSSRAGWR